MICKSNRISGIVSERESDMYLVGATATVCRIRKQVLAMSVLSSYVHTCSV